MATYTYNNTDSYSESKRKYEANLQTIQNSTQKVNQLYLRLEELAYKLSYELRALPIKNNKLNREILEKINIADRRNILNAIITEIKISDNIKEEEKESLIKEIRKIFNTIPKEQEKIEEAKENITRINSEISRIERYVVNIDMDRQASIRIKERKIGEREKVIELYKEIIANPLLADSVKMEAELEIEIEQEKIQKLKEEIEELKRKEKSAGEKLTDDEAREIIEKHKKAQQPTATPEVKQEINPETPAHFEELSTEFERRVGEIIDGPERAITSTSDSESIPMFEPEEYSELYPYYTDIPEGEYNPLIPEEPQKVVGIHKASDKLKEYLKKHRFSLLIGLGSFAAFITAYKVISPESPYGFLWATAALGSGYLGYDVGDSFDKFRKKGSKKR